MSAMGGIERYLSADCSPVQPRDRMGLGWIQGEAAPLEDRLAVDGGLEVIDLEHSTTLPFGERSAA